jgi:hypothetical protein
MISVTGNETFEVELFGKKWTGGMIPLIKLDELLDAVNAEQAPFNKHAFEFHLDAEGNVRADAPACDQCTVLLDASAKALRISHRDAVRWGLKATSAPIELKTEKVALAGKEYVVLADSVIDTLARVGKGVVVRQIATAILDANQLSPRDVLGFA